MTIFDVVFAHHDEPIDAPNLPPANLTERQLKRWKSRRMADFLLRKLCEKHHLDECWLVNIQRTESGRPYVTLPHIDFNITQYLSLTTPFYKFMCTSVGRWGWNLYIDNYIFGTSGKLYFFHYNHYF